MNNQTVLTFCYKSPPVSNAVINPYGYLLEFLNILSRTTGIPLKNVSKVGNGDCTDEEDINLNLRVINHLQITDFSYPLGIDTVTFMAPKREYTPGISAVAHPFSSTVWIATILCALIVTLVLYAFGRKRIAYSDTLKKIIGTFLRQSVDFQHDSRSEKVVMFFWLLCVMVISSGYQSTLLSFLTVPSVSYVKDIRQLAKEVENGRYKIMTRNFFKVESLLSESLDESHRIIGEISRKNQHFGEIEDFMQLSKNSNVAYVDRRMIMKFLESKYFISDDSFMELLGAYTIRKDFCCKRKLDRAIHRMTAAGIFDKEEKFVSHKRAFRAFSKGEYRNVAVEKPLTLLHFSGAFIVLGVGYGFAFVALIAEIIVQRCRKATSKPKRKKKRRVRRILLQ